MSKIETLIGMFMVGIILALSMHTVNACSSVQGNVVRILQR
jgi:putative cofactor-binding repeat protein